MGPRFRPGCIVRSTLALLGVLFLPLAVWFAHAGWTRWWPRVVGLAVFGVLFLLAAVDRRDRSLLGILDDLGGSANPDA